MTEKWWQKIFPGPSWFKKIPDESAFSVNSMRKEWEILEEIGEGVTIYRTPAGIYRSEEKPDGTLIRLERIEGYKPH